MFKKMIPAIAIVLMLFATSFVHAAGPTTPRGYVEGVVGQIESAKNMSQSTKDSIVNSLKAFTSDQNGEPYVDTLEGDEKTSFEKMMVTIHNDIAKDGSGYQRTDTTGMSFTDKVKTVIKDSLNSYIDDVKRSAPRLVKKLFGIKDELKGLSDDLNESLTEAAVKAAQKKLDAMDTADGAKTKGDGEGDTGGSAKTKGDGEGHTEGTTKTGGNGTDDGPPPGDDPQPVGVDVGGDHIEPTILPPDEDE